MRDERFAELVNLLAVAAFAVFLIDLTSGGGVFRAIGRAVSRRGGSVSPDPSDRDIESTIAEAISITREEVS